MSRQLHAQISFVNSIRLSHTGEGLSIFCEDLWISNHSKIKKKSFPDSAGKHFQMMIQLFSCRFELATIIYFAVKIKLPIRFSWSRKCFKVLPAPLTPKTWSWFMPLVSRMPNVLPVYGEKRSFVKNKQTQQLFYSSYAGTKRLLVSERNLYVFLRIIINSLPDIITLYYLLIFIKTSFYI